MQLYCPSCVAAFSGKRDCPNCGVRLIAPGEAHVLPAERVSAEIESVNISVASRVLAGGIAIVGIALGCKEIIAGFLPLMGETDAWFATDVSLAFLLMVRVFAGLVGGILAGAGHEKSVVAGLMAGSLGAAILMAIQMFEPGYRMSVGSVSMTITILSMATFAGWLSGKIWPSRAEIPKTRLDSNGSSLLEQAKELQEKEEAKKIRPTQWIRLILAISLTICGFVGAEGIRNVLAKKSDGVIDIGGTRNTPIICVQIAGIAVLMSGIVAGASTGAGFRHGVYAGLIAGAFIAGLYGLRGPEKLKAVSGLTEILDWPADKVPPVRVASALFGGCFVLQSIGGLFGGMLFPPITLRPRAGRDADIGKPVGMFN